ncbi:hypothetical protein BLX24_11555 [Arsenicibacter rosenii]|uniref:Uncharacterized protein n=1 Tax=Arsenicibacter rosenii TaxID=1750698 RepID=A0A1S2VKD7_9BACT|nr:hypothetical protein BLX24_11555 [Arsenicibacter rosenii]
MLIPIVCSWIKQADNIILQNSRKIGTFMLVTVRTGKCKVVEVIATAMFNRNNMIYLKRQK